MTELAIKLHKFLLQFCTCLAVRIRPLVSSLLASLGLSIQQLLAQSVISHLLLFIPQLSPRHFGDHLSNCRCSGHLLLHFFSSADRSTEVHRVLFCLEAVSVLKQQKKIDENERIYETRIFNEKAVFFFLILEDVMSESRKKTSRS